MRVIAIVFEFDEIACCVKHLAMCVFSEGTNISTLYDLLRARTHCSSVRIFYDCSVLTL